MPRLLGALAQILNHKFAEGMEVIAELSGHLANPGETIYQRMLAVVGPLEDVLSDAAGQEVRLRVGDYFLRGGKNEEAMAWLDAALAKAPTDPLARYLHANCRFAFYGERLAIADMEGVLSEAAAETKRAHFIAGGKGVLWYRLGVAHERIRNLDEAAQYLSEAVARDPSHNSARLRLGDVLIRLDRFEEAIDDLAAIPTHAANYHFAVRLRAVALFRVGQLAAALDLLAKLAKTDPFRAFIFLEMGRIYLARDQVEEAELAIARAFRTDPGLPGLRSAIVALERRLDRHLDPDAGLPEPSSFTIPEEFLPRFPSGPSARRPSLKAGLSSHLRVLHALIVRDIFTRYAHNGMGYLWAIAHPVVYMITLAGLYWLVGHNTRDGVSTIDFLVTGILPFVCFYIRVETAVATAVMSSANLLYFREVTPMALLVANWLREYLTSLVTFALIVAGIGLYRGSLWMPDPLSVLLAVTGMSLIGLIVGALLGLGRLVFPQIELLALAINRSMLILGGALFFANSLPAQWLYWAMFNPLVHLTEFVRDGYLKTYHSHYANWHYAAMCVAIGLTLVMIVMHATRRYMVAPA